MLLRRKGKIADLGKEEGHLRLLNEKSRLKMGGSLASGWRM
jgi:hypothetical protein